MQKQKIRKIGLDEAARVHKWSSLHKQRVKTLLQCDYMSSESSADESGDEAIKSSILRVKKIVRLKKKYRDAFHQIDITYYIMHIRSQETSLKNEFRVITAPACSLKVDPSLL